MKTPSAKKKPSRAAEKASVIAAVVACIGAVISATYTYLSASRGLDIELVKVGIGILSANPKETQTVGAREWAISIIEKYSNQEFSPKAKFELLNSRLSVRSEGSDQESDYVTLRAQIFPNGSGTADPALVAYVRDLLGSPMVAIGPILSATRYATLREKISACIADRAAGKPCAPGSLAQFVNE